MAAKPSNFIDIKVVIQAPSDEDLARNQTTNGTGSKETNASLLNSEQTKESPETEDQKPKFTESARFRWLILGIGLLIVVTVIIVIIVLSHPHPDTDGHHGSENPVTVSLPCGKIEGKVEHGIYSFKGIPYAAPPVGPLRWRPAEPSQCWDGVLKAHSFSQSCMQKNPQGEIIGSEDCLYLNVWTPSPSAGTKLPVIVWVHDGDFATGLGKDLSRIITPDIVNMINSKIVHVTFNYQLGMFGFLNLDVLSKNHSSEELAGSSAILQQNEALQWVKKNIEYFGGDARKVTLYGKGSGARCVLELLLSINTNGLYQRVWMDNIAPTYFLANHTELFLLNTGCSTSENKLECLRSLPAIDIVTSSPTFSNPVDLPSNEFTDTIFQFVLQGSGVIQTKEINDVPVVIGAVPQDIDRLAISANFSNTNWMKNEMENIKKKLNQIDPTGKLEKQFLAYYSQELFVRNMLIDTFYICPMNFLTKEIRKILTSSLYYYIIPEIGDVIEELDHIQDHQFRSYIVLQYNERRDWLVFLYEFANTGYMTEWGVYPNRTFINTSLKPEPISQTNVTLGDKKCTFWKSFQALNDKLNSSKDN